MSDDRNHDFELLAPRPARPGRDLRLRPVEFEDAEFETVIPCDGYGAPEGLHIPHVTPELRKPVFSAADNEEFAAERQRLDLFGQGDAVIAETASARSRTAGPAFLGGVVFVAALVFWMSGGHRLIASARHTDPVTTASVSGNAAAGAIIPQGQAFGDERRMSGEAGNVRRGQPARTGVVDAPRPARIERAGSILMIRAGR
ncbi:hypothetical protein E2A64_13875 [Pseudohoeflea suaedae]|uniref:Uncharacterized protein n=1 Tax=Pseudohoeflea suaedae TaxID=877384 RepID=A0A4V3A6W0_9HYPH|nr:hypothetical protein [Pseudohoeflea suaedae]TDH34828.1 hypothetical protein E2A64_13875 [Pseudohoeflea suaedae]